MAARAIQISELLSGFLDANGDPYSGGTLTVYDEGTLNLTTIYTDAAMGTPASNPITLDTYGSVANPVFCNDNVKLVLKDSLGNTIKTWDELTYATGNLFAEHSSAGVHLVQPVAFSVHRNSVNQTIADSTYTKIEWTTEDFDTNSDYDNSVNYRFTPTVAGKYVIVATVQWDALPGNTTTLLYLYENGAIANAIQNVASEVRSSTPEISVGTDSARPASSIAAVVSDANGWIVPTAADGVDDRAIIPLCLPIGATVTRLDIHGLAVVDANYGTVAADLLRRDITGASWDTMATASFDGNGAQGTTGNDTSISNAVVATGYEYSLLVRVQVLAGGATTNAKFYGAKITFTTTNGGESQSIVAVVDANGSTDYFETFVYQTSGASQDILGTKRDSFFMGYRVGFS